jgi:hypothetical protein
MEQKKQLDTFNKKLKIQDQEKRKLSQKLM